MSSVYRLNKCLYGLKQSPRGWYADIDDYLKANHFVKTQADSCIYTRRSDRGVTIIALYVDDLIIAGSNDAVINEVKKTLKKKYKMKDLGLLDWILGMEVVQDPAAKMIRLNQTKYIQDLLVKFISMIVMYRRQWMTVIDYRSLIAQPQRGMSYI